MPHPLANCHSIIVQDNSASMRVYLCDPLNTCSSLPSNGNIFRATGPLIVRGIHQSPVNSPHKGQWRGVFFDLRMNKLLSKQSWGWWFETPLCSLWRHCNVKTKYHILTVIMQTRFVRGIHRNKLLNKHCRWFPDAMTLMWRHCHVSAVRRWTYVCDRADLKKSICEKKILPLRCLTF